MLCNQYPQNAKDSLNWKRKSYPVFPNVEHHPRHKEHNVNDTGMLIAQTQATQKGSNVRNLKRETVYIMVIIYRDKSGFHIFATMIKWFATEKNEIKEAIMFLKNFWPLCSS